MRLSQQLGDTLRESGLTAAEKKAGRVDARKMSMKEVLSLLADGKEVVVTKKVADKVPSILVKHGIYIRSFRAGPRKEWEGVALITKDQKKLDSLRASLKEEREERALSNVKKKMAPHMIVISKDSAGNFIVSRGDPFKGSSKLLAREKTKADIKLWARDNLGGKYGVYSHDHVLDMTGLKLSPPFFSQWYVDNIMKKEGLGEEVIPGLDIYDLPHGMTGLVVFVENMDAWLGEIRKALGQIGKGKDDPRTLYQSTRTIVGNLGTMKVETDRHHKMVSGAFQKMRRK